MDENKCKSAENTKMNEFVNFFFKQLEKRVKALEEEHVDIAYQASDDGRLKRFKASKYNWNSLDGWNSSAVVPVSSVDIRSYLSLNLSTGQVSSFSRSGMILESSTTSGLISDVCSTTPIQIVTAIDSLVQMVSTTVGPSQRPPIPYTTHMVRNDCYGSSQIPSSMAGSAQSSGLPTSNL
ncbi:hypothetical protein LWI29_021729 [Acer saccharum]|uniref:Uncharacterized protein n=1 Tax=Acer saccharum TaxID=4024 RepID=A0AA39TUI9_ACESA|nr:hypothetical protein LWI29_021729 [Acer saccharum]